METAIESALIDQTWFYPIQWELPCLYFDKWSDDTDNLFHEFDEILFTESVATVEVDISEFLDRIKPSL